MAKTEDNLFADGFTGKVGRNMVFRKRKSGTVIVAKNRRKNNLPPTELQQKVRIKFIESSVYAKTAMKNPELKAMYSQAVTGDQSAYNLALRDAAKSPEVKSVNAAKYTGKPGSLVSVHALDDFKIVSLEVFIYSAAGDLLEKGKAVIQANGLDWLYVATVANAQLVGTKIRAVALDTPGNEGTLEVIL